MKKSRIFLSIIMAALMLGMLLPACTPAKAPAEQGANNSTPVMGDPVEAATLPPDPISAPEEESSNRVMAIGTGSYGGVHAFRYDVNDTIVETVDKEMVGDKRTIEFAGKKYELIYKQTITYITDNVTLNVYSIVGDHAKDEYGYDNHALLFKDGTLESLLVSPIMTLDIKEFTDADAVRAAVEKALKDEIDFSRFEYCDVDCSNMETDGYGLYTFTWYNKKGGIATKEDVRLCVKQSGNVSALKMSYKSDYGLDKVPDDISLEKYIPDIEKKLHKVYGKEFVGYEIWKDSIVLTNVGGEPCLYCRISVTYMDIEYGREFSELIEIAVVINP